MCCARLLTPSQPPQPSFDMFFNLNFGQKFVLKISQSALISGKVENIKKKKEKSILAGGALPKPSGNLRPQGRAPRPQSGLVPPGGDLSRPSGDLKPQGHAPRPSSHLSGNWFLRFPRVS
jgi:hypothetical protein